MSFIVKMGRTPEQRVRTNELRKIEKGKRRQAYFVSEYINAKDFHLYREATNFFNALNTLYPTKSDLRKTIEFRSWRTATVAGEGISKPKHPYETIDMSCIQNQWQSPENHQVESPESHQVESPEAHQAESPENHQVESPESHQVESPETHQAESPENHQVESPETHQAESPENHQVESPDSHQVESPKTHRWKDCMQLKIPLMKYKRKKATVTTETLQIVTEQTVEQSDITVNDLTDASIQEIIEQLRQDPELNQIFNDMDFDMDFDIDFDQGIDIENYIRLENELLAW